MKKIIVVKYGGSLMDDKNAQKCILNNINKLSEKYSVVVVHGGGKDITSALKKAKIESKFIKGLRYTDEKAVKVVESVLEEIQKKIAKRLKNAVAVRKAVIGKRITELGYVGRFLSAKLKDIQDELRKGKTVVLSPVGKSKSGQVLNFNADEAASGIAALLKAEKLIFFTDVPGVLDARSKTIPLIKTRGINNLIRTGVITGGMIPKIQGCAKAIAGGIGEVDIFNINMKGTKIL